MTNQTTDEAAVEQCDLDAAADLIEQYWSGADDAMTSLAASTRAGHRHGAFPRAFARHRHATSGTLRAQLTAATRRAVQAERMLAERDAALQLTRESLCKAERMLAEAVKILEPFAGHCDKRGEKITLKWGLSTYTNTLRPDDFYDASEFIRSIRSAASGGQG